MTIPYRNAGDKKLPARDYNQLVDAANITLRNRPISNSEANENEGRTPGTILIRNDTGEDRERGDAVGIGDQLYDLNYYRIEMKNNSLFAGVSLTSAHVGRFAILAEPIKDGETGEAYIALECYAKIWIPAGATLETHGSADVFDVTTSPNNLTAIGSGTCQILWFDDTVSDALGDAKVRFSPKHDGVPFINESGETVPPYGVMQVSEIDANGLAHIVKPDGEPRNAVPYLINRGAEVVDNYMGVGDWALDGHAKALLDSSLISYTNMGSKSLDAAVGGWYLTSHNPTDREAFGFFQLGRYGTSNPTVDGVSCVIASVLQTIESPTLSYNADYELMQDFAGSSISHLSTYLGNTNGYLLFANSTGAPVPHNFDYAGIRGGWKKLDPSNPVSLNGNFECVRKGYYLIECEIPYYTTVDNENDLFDTVNTSTESSHSHTYQKLNLNKAFGDAKFASILKVNSTPIYWYKESASLCESGSHKQMYGSYSAVFDIGDQISVEISITSPGYDWSAFVINSPGDINFPRLRITRLRNWRGIV